MISGYGGYDIGFAAHSNFSIDGEWGKNVICGKSLLVHTDKRKKRYGSSW